jgi:hypothetical protein
MHEEENKSGEESEEIQNYLTIMNRAIILSARIKKTWRILGPGVITGASDDDPSGIATYSQAGAGFGFATLWTAMITFPLIGCCAGDVRANRYGNSRGIDSNTKKEISKKYFISHGGV